MAVKVARGGKYAKTKHIQEPKKKYKKEKEEYIDVEMSKTKIGDKIYYVLKYADTGEIIKSAPKWRNDKSPRKWAEKHNFNFIS